MRNKLFLDTAYAIALAADEDQLHRKAELLANEVALNGTNLFTTRAVLLEIGNGLSKRRFRSAAIALLTALETDTTVEVIDMSPELYLKGVGLFQKRADKEWGLVDCISIVVMEQNGITEALTSDIHFEQAGFVALLRS